MFESKEQKQIDFEKQLYKTKLIQDMFDSINELESRIAKLEGEQIDATI